MRRTYFKPIAPEGIANRHGSAWKILSIAFAVAVLTLAASRAYAQGSIAFQNTANSLVLYEGIPVDVTSNSGIKVQLMYQPDDGGQAPDPFWGSYGNAWELAGSPVNIGPVAGRFGASLEVTGTDVSPAGNVWLDVIEWNGGYTSLSAAENGGAFIGWSTVWSQGTGNGNTIPPVSTTSYFQGVDILLIPEPGTIALAGLGAATLLLFRRRKK